MKKGLKHKAMSPAMVSTVLANALMKKGLKPPRVGVTDVLIVVLANALMKKGLKHRERDDGLLNLRAREWPDEEGIETSSRFERRP